MWAVCIADADVGAYTAGVGVECRDIGTVGRIGRDPSPETDRERGEVLEETELVTVEIENTETGRTAYPAPPGACCNARARGIEEWIA